MPTMEDLYNSCPLVLQGKNIALPTVRFLYVEGEGKTTLGDTEIHWTENDTFVIPSWVPHSHNSSNIDAVLFSFSDRAIQQKCGLWREKRYSN